jgi:hypothetical protein
MCRHILVKTIGGTLREKSTRVSVHGGDWVGNPYPWNSPGIHKGQRSNYDAVRTFRNLLYVVMCWYKLCDRVICDRRMLQFREITLYMSVVCIY